VTCVYVALLVYLGDDDSLSVTCVYVALLVYLGDDDSPSEPV